MDCSLLLIYFDCPHIGTQKKHNVKNYWSRDMFNFDFSEKGMGIVSQPHFVNDFLRQVVFRLYSINWPNFIVWLPLFLEALGNICFATICFPGYDVISFQMNLIFLIKPFLYRTKRQNLEYLESKTSFWGELKIIF